MKPRAPKVIHGILPGVTPLKKISRKTNFEEMQPAIVDGKTELKAGDEVVLRRDHLNDKKLYVCTVSEVHENGDISMHNETLGQRVIFNVRNPMNVRTFLK